MQSHIDCISICCLPYACSYSFSMFQKHYSFWGPSSDDDDYDVNIRAQRQAAPPNAGFRLWSTGKNVRTVSFSLISLCFPKARHILSNKRSMPCVKCFEYVHEISLYCFKFHTKMLNRGRGAVLNLGANWRRMTCRNANDKNAKKPRFTQCNSTFTQCNVSAR